MIRESQTVASFLFRETLLALVLGGIPCTLMIRTTGVDGLSAYMRGLAPPDIVVWYYAALLLLHFAAAGLHHFWIKPNDSVDAALHSANRFSDQIGFSILGLFRTVAGAILVIPIAIIVAEPGWNTFLLLCGSHFFAGCCIWVCCGLSLAQIRTTARGRNPL